METPNRPGNYTVKFRKKEWQDIILNPTEGSLKKVSDAGFDGVCPDKIDSFEYCE